MTVPQLSAGEEAVVDRYLAVSKRAKYRRLAALVVMSVLLVAVLIVIYAMGWTQIGSGETAQDAGGAWVIVGIAVGIIAIAGVAIDIFYRRDV